MLSPPPRHHALAVALGLALAAAVAPASAQQVIADGDEQTPAAGDYTTTEPVEPGNPAGHAFYAINGGSIVPAGPVTLRTQGQTAAGAAADGVGSRISLAGSTIETSGLGGSGLLARNGAHVEMSGGSIATRGATASGMEVIGGSATLDNVSITTHGGLSHGLFVTDGSAQVRNSVITTHGSSSNGIETRGNASLQVENLRIEHGGGGTGVFISGTTDAMLRSVQINGNGAGSNGVLVARGSRAVLENVDVNLNHARSGAGLDAGGSVEMRGGSLHARGDNASIANVADQGVLVLDGVEASGHFGIRTLQGSALTLRNTMLSSERAGIDINQSNAVVQVVNSSITTGRNEGIIIGGNSRLLVDQSDITTHGASAAAISALNGEGTIKQTRLRTTGDNGHGLYADGNNGAAPLMRSHSVDVLTEGRGAIGAIARLGGSNDLTDSRVRTTGASAHGALSGGSGAMALRDTHVRTEGEGAWAAVINDRGSLDIKGGSLVSAQHGGVWVRSSRDAGLALGGGAIVSGGNGIGLALDAAVAGRFDVSLRDRAQLHGDIVITPDDVDAGLVPQSQVHAQLSGGSLWVGASSLLQSVSLEGSSLWTLTGDARVQGKVALMDSGIALSDGSGRFNVLTIDGDLHSERGSFLFQGALGDDGSAIDRLHVRGDATGDASIAVQNIGGLGAPTRDGIPLIQIDGASLATYRLAGRAVGGSYEYFLHKGSVSRPGDGQWYLRSELGDPCDLDPTAPGCVVDPGPGPGPGPGPDPTPGPDPEDGGEGEVITPPAVLRPEAGAYLANQSAALGMFSHRLQDRGALLATADTRAAWARVGHHQADARAVEGQLAMQGGTSLLQIGADVWRAGRTSFGVMLGSGRASTTAVSQLTGYSATGRVRGTAAGLYATWHQQDDGALGAYADLSVQHGRFDNRVQGIGLPMETYAARSTSASLEAGHTFTAWSGAASRLYVQPQVQVSHSDYRMARHVEGNGTVVGGADAGGLSGRLGVRVFGHATSAGNRVQPYAGVHWLRASTTGSLQFNGQTMAADIPRDRYEVRAGAELKLGHRWGAWGGLGVQHGSGGFREVNGQVGMRLAW